MKSIILQKPRQFTLKDIAQTQINQYDEALVKVHRVGICGTDLHAFEGNQTFFEYPRIIGHELGVEIVEIDKNDYGLKIGDRCAVEPYLNCGDCIACRRGKPNCCTQLKVLGVHIDGGMREYFSIPVYKLHKSNTLSHDQLALVETLGIGAHAVRRAEPRSDDTILVLGCGPIGLTVITFARTITSNIVVMDINENRLDFCQNIMNIQHCLNSAENPIEQIKDIFSGELPTVVFDCTGNPQSMEKSFNYVASGGSLVFVGHFKGNITFHDPEFHRKEITLHASRNATASDMKQIIVAMEKGEIDTTPWITHRASYLNMVEEFPNWLKPESRVLKAMVEW